jgi:hypothetical protein
MLQTLAEKPVNIYHRYKKDFTYMVKVFKDTELSALFHIIYVL